MTAPEGELTRLLTGAADDIVERNHAAGPDAPGLWRRGRRATWLGRGITAGLVAAVVLVGSALVAVVRSPVTVPSDGASLTYPQLVSDLLTKGRAADPGKVFALVTLPGSYPQASSTGVVERSGDLVGLPRWSAAATPVDASSLGGVGNALAPDGVHLFTSYGIVDLADGTLTRPLLVEGVPPLATGSGAVWSPDSQHVAASTADGPVVVDRFDDVVLEPAAGDTGVLLAGWRDDGTLLGVRGSPTDGAVLDVVSRGLTDDRWSTVSTIGPDAVTAAGRAGGRVTPSAAYASPDGSRVLLVDRGGRSVLVDVETGRRVAFAGAATASTAATWDACDPVWQNGQPLLADGGLKRPGDGTAVLAFSDRVDAGCVTVAGNELTGTPAPGREWRERVWSVALPVFWVLLLVAAVWLTVWMVVALRRSRKHGEDFLPMMLGRLF